MSDSVGGRRKRGRVKPQHIAKMHSMVKAAQDNGYDCQSASMDNDGDEGPTMSMRLRPNRRGRKPMSPTPPGPPTEGPLEPTNG